MPASSFGVALRHIREAKGMSLRELAARVDVDHSYLSKIEADKKRPSRRLVAKLAEALDAPGLYLAAGLVPPEKAAKRIEELLRLLQYSTPGEGGEEERISTPYPAEDPMQEYLRFAKSDDFGFRDLVYSQPEEFVSAWETFRLPISWLDLIPPLRKEIIEARWNWRTAQGDVLFLDLPQEAKDIAEQAGYFAGYEEALEKGINILRDLYQNHKDGLYWVLAAILMPPKKARVLADIYRRLEAVGFDEYAVKAVMELLHAWQSRYRSQEEEQG